MELCCIRSKTGASIGWCEKASRENGVEYRRTLVNAASPDRGFEE